MIRHTKENRLVKYIVIIGVLTFVVGCSSSIRLAVPEVFKQQATMYHVNGARGNKMSFENFSTSKIKRGIHVSYPGWNRGFFLENLLLNQAGIQKNEIVRKEKAKFRYTLSDGKAAIEVYGEEKEVTKTLEYKLINGDAGIFSSYKRLQKYTYVFSALIGSASTGNDKPWELVMTNVYDKKKENDQQIFKILRPDDNGIATNGSDTLFIKGVSIKETEAPNGKSGKLPIKLLSGYELSTPGGVVAIIDMIDRNIWFYNELDEKERLNISAIATALFARKINDTKW